MIFPLKTSVAVRLANRIGRRARELRRDLRDHVRSESFRIYHAEKRARGLRLYAAWSRRPHRAVMDAATGVWHPAQSVA